MKKNTRGITLIALVVTIIVLLILAGVSILMLTGQNGILNRAKEAKEQTQEANSKEKLGLILTDLQMDAYKKGSEIKIGEELAAEIKSKTDDGVSSAEYDGSRIIVGIDDDVYYIDESLNITDAESGNLAKRLNVEIENKVHIKITSADVNAYKNVSDNESNLIEIINPDGEGQILDLSDENSEVYWWAYKGGNFLFNLYELQYEEGNPDNITGEISSEVLRVNVEIPDTEESYFEAYGDGSVVRLANFYSYYDSGNRIYPVDIIKVPNNLGNNLTYDLANGGISLFDNITTVILSNNITKLFRSAPYGTNDELKTLYIPASVKDISNDYVFRDLISTNAKIYFEASGPSETWGENWNSGIENDRIYWNK